MTSYTVAEVATALDAQVDGDATLTIERPCHPGMVRGPQDLAVAMAPKLVDLLADSPAVVAVVGTVVDRQKCGLQATIIVGEPRVALANLTRHFDSIAGWPTGIHPSACVAEDAEVDPSAAVGPFVDIGSGARVAAGVKIFASVSIGAGVTVGRDSVLYPGVRLGDRVQIGERAILHSNVCVGADGFSFIPVGGDRVAQARAGKIEPGGTGTVQRIHSLGTVLVGHDVEIGANTAIDRGTIADTTIGDDTKIDNLVHIAHNVQIGRHCLICGQVGLAGSAQIGDRTILGGQVGVGDHVGIGADCVIGGKSLIGRQVPPESMLVGWASLSRGEFHSVFRTIRKLARREQRGNTEDG